MDKKKVNGTVNLKNKDINLRFQVNNIFPKVLQNEDNNEVNYTFLSKLKGETRQKTFKK